MRDSSERRLSPGAALGVCAEKRCRFRDLAAAGGRPFWAFTSGVVVNVILGLLLSTVVFDAYWSRTDNSGVNCRATCGCDRMEGLDEADDALAALRNTGYQTLLKEFVVERLYEEEKREGII